MPKFGIAGYGGRGKLIASKLVGLGFEVLGVYDSNPAQLADAPFRTFADLDCLLKLDVDAVAVATWPSSHADIAERALESGFDVLVEKPMGATVDQSLRIVQVQRRAGRLVVAGYVERLNPAITKLREIGNLADVARSREIRIGPIPRYAPTFSEGTGVLLDLGSHGIDMAYHLFQAEPRVRSACISIEREGDPEYECMVEFDCGKTRSHVEARRANIRRRRLELDTDEEYYEVTYTPAALKVGFPPPKLRRRPQSFEDLEQLSRNVETSLDLPRAEPVKVMLQLFAESIRKGSVIDPLCSAEQALVTSRTIDDAKKIVIHRIVKKESGT